MFTIVPYDGSDAIVDDEDDFEIVEKFDDETIIIKHVITGEEYRIRLATIN